MYDIIKESATNYCYYSQSSWMYLNIYHGTQKNMCGKSIFHERYLVSCK